MNEGEVRLLSGRVKGTLVGLLPGTADEESEREREGFEVGTYASGARSVVLEASS